jgi:hypothetical protein
LAAPHADARAQHAAETAAAIAAVYAAMKVDVLDRLHAGFLSGLLSRRWRTVLAEAVNRVLFGTASDIGALTAADLYGEHAPFDPAYLANYVEAVSDSFATGRVDDLRQEFDQIVADLVAKSEAEAVAEVQATMDRLDAETDAKALTNAAANFGAHDAARAVGATEKTWRTGSNPRPTHRALNGSTVNLDQVFANGLHYPGAPGPPEETANCNCWLDFGMG